MTTFRRVRPCAVMNRGAVRPLAVCVLLGGAIAAAALTRAHAQEPPGPSSADLRFEVASIKPNKKTFQEHFLGGQGAFSGMRALPGGRKEASYMAMRPLIMRAYEVKFFQLQGGPAWLDDERYDIRRRQAARSRRRR